MLVARQDDDDISVARISKKLGTNYLPNKSNSVLNEKKKLLIKCNVFCISVVL